MGSLDYSLDVYLEAKLRALSETQDNNIIVYSGYSPFVGFGQKIGSWSFTVDVSKGKRQGEREATPESFPTTEIYDYLTDRLSSLGIEGLSLEEKLFVNGQEIRNDARFLPNPYERPSTHANAHLVQEIKEHSTQNVRYYTCVQVTSWGGELILSVFLRFSRVGKNLFTEADYLLLTPVRQAYRRVDTIEGFLTPRKFLQIMLQSLVFAILSWLFSPFLLLERLVTTWMHVLKMSRMHHTIDENPAFDYGAISSLREFAASRQYQQHFQTLDQEMYVQILQNQILDSIVGFLDEKNIDTTDLKKRQEVINNGVMISGGEFKGENIAIGERAKAFVSNLTGVVGNATTVAMTGNKEP